jgi:PTS system nitrogen regulatory IIA component
MVKISKYLDEKLILFVDLKTREEVIRALVAALFSAGKITNEEAFYQAILEREKIVSTGIGMGVAIPHAKLADYDDFFMAMAILPRGVDWQAVDGVSVRLIFMIGGPDDKQTEYLQILSNLTSSIKDEERRKKILTSNSPAATIELFKAF